MSVFSRILSAFSRRFDDWMDRDPATKAIKESWEGGPTVAGISVSESTALTYSAVWSAVQVISSGVASLPLKVYRRRREDGGREEVPTGDLAWLLREEPSAEMTPYVWKETLMVHLLLTGNAFAEIVRTEGGRIHSLEILNPREVEVGRDNSGALVYTVKGKKKLPASSVFHVPGLGFDGLVGYSPVTKARESFALGLAVEKFGAAWFGNGAWPGIVARHPKSLTREAYERIRDGWNATHKGSSRAHKIAILEEGMEIDKVGVSPEDSQFLETRQFQVVEVARWFNVSPTKLRDLGRATWSNIEAENIDFVVGTLRPWLIRIEQEINRKLIPARDRGVVFAEFKIDAVLRGDTATRYGSYAIGRQWGWLSANDIRKMENLDPIENGDLYLVPSNMMTAEQAAEPPAPPPPPPAPAPAGEPEPAQEDDQADDQAPDEATDEGERKARLAIAHRALVVDALGRMVRAEAAAARRAATKGPEALEAFRSEFYSRHRAKLAGALLPAVAAHLAAIGSDEAPGLVAASLADDHVRRSLDDLSLAAGEAWGSLEERVDTLVSRWEIERPEALADTFQREALNVKA